MILHEFIPLHHVIFLNVLLSSYELNTLDAGRSRSTCYGLDAYIHDHA